MSGTVWGSFSGELSTRVRPYVTWEVTSQSTANNTSTVKAILYFKSYGAWHGYGTCSNTSIRIGTTTNYGSKSFNVAAGATVKIQERTRTVTHNSNGTLSVTIGGSGSTNIYWGSFNFSSSVSLPTITRATVVTTSVASSVGGTSASIGGNVTDVGIPACSSRGVDYSLASSFSPHTSKAVGSGGGSFSTTITGLTRGTLYYFRAWSYNTSHGYKRGVVRNFTTTASAPSVTTGSTSSLGVTTVTIGGNVTNDNGAAVTARGICYSTSLSPTTSDSTVSAGSGTGSFTAGLTGLSPSTQYYARAYATNSVGTTYGANLSFTTESGVPGVTTQEAVENLTHNSVKVFGEVVTDSGSGITERGFVYSTGPDPDTNDTKVTVAGELGAIEKVLTGLSPGAKYYFRGYAVNNEGEGYGGVYSFVTKPVAPTNFNIQVKSKEELGLTWTRGTGALYTIVRRGTTPPSNINSGELVYQGTGLSYDDSGLDAGVEYYYRAWSATTADWSEAYSETYAQAQATTIANFVNPQHALVDDSNYTEVLNTDGTIKAQVSKDGGQSWSDPEEIDLGGVWEFPYKTIGEQPYEIDLAPGTYEIEMYGTRGQTGSGYPMGFGYSTTPGDGGYVKGTFEVTSQMLRTLEIWVGGGGHRGKSNGGQRSMTAWQMYGQWYALYGGRGGGSTEVYLTGFSDPVFLAAADGGGGAARRGLSGGISYSAGGGGGARAGAAGSGGNYENATAGEGERSYSGIYGRGWVSGSFAQPGYGEAPGLTDPVITAGGGDAGGGINGLVRLTQLESTEFLGGDIQDIKFGAGDEESWGMSWTGADLTDGNFRVKLSSKDGSSYQIYKNFGISIPAGNTLTGLAVELKLFRPPGENNVNFYTIKARPVYGTSPLPIKEGSLAYNLTQSLPTFYDGIGWESLAKKSDLQTLEDNLWKKVYPVGAVYVSYTSTSPGTLFGGTWVSCGVGKMFIGVDSNDEEFNTAGDTGGEKGHTLTTAEMPAHTHTQNSHAHGNTGNNHRTHTHNTPSDNYLYGWLSTGGTLIGTTGENRIRVGNFQATDDNQTHYHGTSMNTATNQNTGGGEVHNNLPPYEVVYKWRRTA